MLEAKLAEDVSSFVVGLDGITDDSLTNRANEIGINLAFKASLFDVTRPKHKQQSVPDKMHEFDQLTLFWSMTTPQTNPRSSMMN